MPSALVARAGVLPQDSMYSSLLRMVSVIGKGKFTDISTMARGLLDQYYARGGNSCSIFHLPRFWLLG
jgi:hypothetical protein